MAAYLAIQAHDFVKRNWPFGAPLPTLYCYPAGHAHGSRTSLHAKCVVVDSRYVIVGSANFTQRGHKRNVEIGVLLDDPILAAAIHQQFDGLRSSGSLGPLHVAAAEQRIAAATEDENDGVEAAEALATELGVIEEARELFVELARRGLPVPEVGADLESDKGSVLGTAELSWEEAHVAVLLAEQQGSRRKLEAAGWICFSVPMRDDETAALCERVRNGGG